MRSYSIVLTHPLRRWTSSKVGCGMRYFNIITDFIFIADVIKHFNTGFVDTYDCVYAM